ncbi:MAG TPA: RagB/SusD family nutrient uptake outer membrane protein [Hymenobacter sp.]|jgi:hypothetical protein
MNKMILRRLATVAVAAGLGVAAPGCNIDRLPEYEQTSEAVFADFNNYKPLLAKLYAGLAVTGQARTDAADISGLDEGYSQYLRAYFTHQELTTDEAVMTWNDQTVQNFHAMTWTSTDVFVRAMYSRVYYQISLCNEFLRQTTDAQLSERGISGANAETTRRYRAEARFLRALSYWHAIDLFGNVPFTTEEDLVGANFQPRQAARAEVFNYIESELKAIGDDGGPLADARQNEYARADKAAAWTLLAKLYLNAEVYTGTARYTDCLTYASKVIGADYQLNPNGGLPAGANNRYRNLFLADNNTSPEIIFPIAFDGTRTQSFGGMTYLVNASVGGAMPKEAFGVANGGWGGYRATQALTDLFPDPARPDTTQNNPDRRFLFYTNGQSREINVVRDRFTDGFAYKKFRNVTSNLQPGTDVLDRTHPDTDFPMFRLADVYLMYAEAVLRGGTGGSAAQALTYINNLRERAYGNPTGNITAAQLNLNFILDERARELYGECHRRTDLIRFGRFVSGKNWPWKGDEKAGRDVEPFRVLFPIPTADLTVNQNLRQNPGY